MPSPHTVLLSYSTSFVKMVSISLCVSTSIFLVLYIFFTFSRRSFRDAKTGGRFRFMAYISSFYLLYFSISYLEFTWIQSYYSLTERTAFVVGLVFLPSILFIVDLLDFYTSKLTRPHYAILLLIFSQTLVLSFLVHDKASLALTFVSTAVIIYLFLIKCIEYAHHLKDNFSVFSLRISRGRSMRTSIGNNRFVAVATNYKGYEPSVGDIIEFVPPFKVQLFLPIILHRITAIESKIVRTKGDDGPTQDPPILWGSVNGPLVATFNEFGEIVKLYSKDIDLNRMLNDSIKLSIKKRINMLNMQHYSAGILRIAMFAASIIISVTIVFS